MAAIASTSTCQYGPYTRPNGCPRRGKQQFQESGRISTLFAGRTLVFCTSMQYKIRTHTSASQ